MNVARIKFVHFFAQKGNQRNARKEKLGSQLSENGEGGERDLHRVNFQFYQNLRPE